MTLFMEKSDKPWFEINWLVYLATFSSISANSALCAVAPMLLPMTDVTVLEHSAALFVVLFSRLLLAAKISFRKGIFLILLVVGVSFTVQPEFLFPSKNTPMPCYFALQDTFSELHESIAHDKKYFVGLGCGVGVAMVYGLLLTLLSDKIAEMNQEHIFLHSGLIFIILLWPFLDIPGLTTEGTFNPANLIEQSTGGFLGGISAAMVFKAVDFTTPTIVGVVATVEIVFVLLIQVFIVQEEPNMLKIAGCIIVGVSIIVIVLDDFLAARSEKETNNNSKK